MVTFSDFLLNDDGTPRSGATVSIKPASHQTPNPNDVIGSVLTNVHGEWSISAPDGQQYDIFVQDGQQQIQYRGYGSIPHSFNDGQVALGANIQLTKLDEGAIADVGDPAVYVPTTLQGRLGQIAGLIGRIKTGLNTDWLAAPPITLDAVLTKFHSGLGHKHTGTGTDAPPIAHTTLTAIGTLTHAALDALFNATTGHKHTGVAGDGPVLPTPRVSVTHGSVQGINSVTYTNLIFTAEVGDTDNMHDPAVNPSRLIAKSAGAYHVWCNVNWVGNPTGYRLISLVKNAATIYASATEPGNGAGNGQSLGVDVDLAVNEFMEVQVYQNSGTGIGVGAGVGQLLFGMHRFSA